MNFVQMFMGEQASFFLTHFVFPQLIFLTILILSGKILVVVHINDVLNSIYETSEGYIDRIEILDSNGLVVVGLDKVGVSPTISTASLSSGVYFLRITSKKKTSVVKIIEE